MVEPQVAAQQGSKDISAMLARISEMSVETYYNPYKMFQWPESLPDEQWWMSPELMTVAGTRFERDLPERQLMALSKWESLHFYSLNVHGIRELLLEVVKRVHSPGFEEESEFFHHFVGEENEHMWFFARFCLNYGRIYPDKKLSFPIGEVNPDIESFLVFARVLIFEEIVDFFNLRMGKDERLHPIIQQVNSIHHMDESRHIAFGREIVKKLFDHIRDTQPAEQVRQAQDYVGRYLAASVQSLYSPAVYRDAGVADPYGMRTELLADPVRLEADRKTIKRTLDYMQASGILTSEVALR
jgi:hypothetical protein